MLTLTKSIKMAANRYIQETWVHNIHILVQICWRLFIFGQICWKLCLFAQIYWQLLWTFLEIFAYLHRYFHWLGWFSFDDKYLLINRRGARALTSESIHSRIFLLIGRRCLSKAFFSEMPFQGLFLLVFLFTIFFSPWEIDQNHWSVVLVSPAMMHKWPLLSNALVSF